MSSPNNTRNIAAEYSRLLVIWNNAAGQSAAGTQARAALDQYGQRGMQVKHRDTRSATEASELAAGAGRGTIVVAAGGDGTVHTVAQGLLDAVGDASKNQTEADGPPPALGVIPLGTANDFSRSLGLPEDPLRAVDALSRAEVRRLDAVRVDVDGQRQWMINAAAGGNAAEVGHRINREQKRRWGPWCYVRGVIDVMTDLQGYSLRVEVDDADPMELDAYSILLSQGRTIGSVEVASRSDLEDGQVELIVIKQAAPIETAHTAAEFFAGDYLQSEQVVYRRAECVTVFAETRMGFSIDGETTRGTAFRFTVQPASLPALVGAEYRRQPSG